MPVSSTTTAATGPATTTGGSLPMLSPNENGLKNPGFEEYYYKRPTDESPTVSIWEADRQNPYGNARRNRGGVHGSQFSL
jgi:hypothetical protein